MEPSNTVLVKTGANVLRKLVNPRGFLPAESPIIREARDTMSEPGWLRNLVMAMIALLDVAMNEVYESVVGLREAMHFLVNAEQIHNEFKKMKDEVTPYLLIYVRRGETELAAKLLRVCYDRYNFEDDDESMRAIETQIVNYIQSDLNSTQVFQRRLSEVHRILLDFVPPIEKYREFFVKVCKVIRWKAQSTFDEMQQVLALNIWMAIYQKFLGNPMRLGGFTSKYYIIQLLAINASHPRRFSTPLLLNASGSIRERAFAFLKLLSIRRSLFLRGGPENEAIRVKVFEATRRQLDHWTTSNRLVALDYLLHLKRELIVTNNQVLRRYLVETLDHLLSHENLVGYGLELNNAGGTKLI